MKQLAALRKGYVRILICGEQTERFLNLCKARDIIFYDLKREDRQILKGCLTIADFFKLEAIHRKTKVKIHILEKHGLPFFFYRSKKRKAFFLGILLGLMLLVTFSGRLWNIEVQGNVKNSTPEILAFLEDQGIVHGMSCDKISCSKTAAMLREKYPDITWVSAKVKGTRLVLTIKEGLFVQQDNEQSKQPCNIIADSEGEIVKMVTRAGVPQKTVGDLCKKGELLVSGILELKNDSQETVRYEPVQADADVYIRRKKAYYREIPLRYAEEFFLDKEKKGFYLKIGTLYLGIGDRYQNGWMKRTEEKQLFLTESFRLPIFFGEICQKQYKILEKQYTEEEVRKLAWNTLQTYEEKLIQKGVQISANNVKIEVKHETCISKGFLEIIEKIGEETPVEIPEQPAERTTENG